MFFHDPYNAYSADYERQQLNLLRRHRGQSPVPPPPRQIDIIESAFVWSFHFILALVLFFALILWWTPEDSPQDSTPSMNGWQTVASIVLPLILLGWLRARRAARLAAEYQRLLDQWDRAGRP